MSFRKIILSVALSVVAIGAQADLVDSLTNNGLISISGGDSNIVVPSTNDFLPSDVGLKYNVGGNISATADVELTFTYLGKEAGFDNDFFALGAVDAQFNNSTTPIGTSFVGNSALGLIDFKFVSNDPRAEDPGFVENGANRPFNSDQSFATLFDYVWDGGAYYDFILFFDDSGANNDDNHDDLIVGVNAVRTSTVEVSSPSVIALFGLSLLVVGLRRRLNA